jgi:tetratricopeptide (TPR) repeat protein
MAHQYLGFTHLRLKAVDEAIASYETAVGLDPVDWTARKGLGVAYMMKASAAGDDSFIDKGLSQWQRSLEIRPGQPELKEWFAKYTK